MKYKLEQHSFLHIKLEALNLIIKNFDNYISEFLDYFENPILIFWFSWRYFGLYLFLTQLIALHFLNKYNFLKRKIYANRYKYRIFSR